MSQNVLRYVGGCHTAKGFYSLYPSNLEGIEHLFLLKGKLFTAGSKWLQHLVEAWSTEGDTIEVMQSSEHPGEVEAVLLPEQKVAIYGGSTPLPPLHKVKKTIISLDQALLLDELDKDKQVMERYTRKIAQKYEHVHRAFQKGLRIHDDLEQIYIQQMDFGKADEEANRLIEKLFTEKTEKASKQVHRFLGSSTPEGPKDYIQHLTASLDTRYFLKGRAGTGKSTFLRHIIRAAEENGYDMEIYHCGFDPESIDMVVLRELSVALFDSTSPHEYFPERDGDHLIDLYDIAVMPETDEKYAKEIAITTKRYKSWMKKGSRYLKEAKEYFDKREALYEKAVDKNLLDGILRTAEQRVNQLLKKEDEHH